MVVDRIFLEWSRHRIIAAKGGEAFSHGYGDAARAIRSKSFRRRENELVELRMGMAAVDISLSDNAGVELPPLERGSFEIERSLQG